MHAFHDHCRRELAQMKAEGRYRTFADLSKSRQGFPRYTLPDGREVLVWSSNDYLGLGGSDILADAARRAVEEHGVGSGGTRNISGNTPYHVALEAELATLHRKEAALVFTSGYVANQAAVAPFTWRTEARAAAAMQGGMEVVKMKPEAEERSQSITAASPAT